ncbi:hypothetical protein VR010_10170 [Actinomycetaceae bacterium L2_0104]
MSKTSIFHLSELPGELRREELYKAVKAGTLRRLRRSWYADVNAPADISLAISKGLRLTCLSAAKHYGLWTPPHRKLHVYAVHCRSGGSGASGGFIDKSVIPHPYPHLTKWPDYKAIASLHLTLLHAGRCLSVPSAAILFESALNLRMMSPADVRAIVQELPQHRRVALSRLRSDAQSGTETKVRWFLEGRRYSVRSQVPIPEVGRVDLVVGASLAIECDSFSYHGARTRYYEDRRRDSALIALGYTPIRLTWEDVFLNWDSTKARLLGILATRRHRYLRPT